MQQLLIAVAAQYAGPLWLASAREHSCVELHLHGSTMASCRADSITWDMVAKEAETGKAYLHKHKDVNGQPVIVIRSSLHVTGTDDVAHGTLQHLSLISMCFGYAAHGNHPCFLMLQNLFPMVQWHSLLQSNPA